MQAFAENQNTSGVIVYPNPANGIDIITFSIPQADKNLSLTITDLSGKIVLSLSNEIAKTDKIILTNNTLTKGVYFYKLSGDKSNHVGKLVIN